ncbi:MULTISPECIES: hypothetical protein [unclassified Streptomyces]|uniref:hypothetical protein n=1 Tax=unclassified Streptomyces TaxID=2593676 RepID=UPI0037F18C74
MDGKGATESEDRDQVDARVAVAERGDHPADRRWDRQQGPQAPQQFGETLVAGEPGNTSCHEGRRRDGQQRGLQPWGNRPGPGAQPCGEGGAVHDVPLSVRRACLRSVLRPSHPGGAGLRQGTNGSAGGAVQTLFVPPGTGR